MIKVSAVQDDSSHWYIIPSELKKQFYKDLDNLSNDTCNDFDEKYSQYMTGGDINLVQLYAEI
jgi:hypothetical protein